jgi:hypothetical protein
LAGSHRKFTKALFESAFDKVPLQEEELDSERSEDPEPDDGRSDPEAESEEDPFVAGNGNPTALNYLASTLTFNLKINLLGADLAS